MFCLDLPIPDQEFELIKIGLDKGVLAIILLIIGVWLSKRLEEYKFAQQQAGELDKIRRIEEERRIVRYYIPKVEFEMVGSFHGPQSSAFIFELLLMAHNKGNARRKFKEIAISIRGISKDEDFQFWRPESGKRLSFPSDLVKENLIPEKDGYYFVEPGVKQTFTYITMIPQNISFIRVHITIKTINEAEEHSSENTFTEERLFYVK